MCIRDSQGTCINQRPIVSLHQQVEDGQVIADGPATCNGEVSLGKNALIGFMTWEGYNYEDAVLINEMCIRDRCSSARCGDCRRGSKWAW